MSSTPRQGWRAGRTGVPAGLHAAVLAAVLATVLAAALAGGLTGCSATGATGPRDRLTVLAAASLTDVFAELADDFEQAHPGVDVRLSFAGSSTLVAQAVEGAPADVLATASAETMADAVATGTVAGPTTFAGNTLVIAVPAGNPGAVDSLADLADPDRTVVLCAPQVPCGAATAQAFTAAGLVPAADSLEQDVRAVLTKVALGEADAGLVYATDVQAADRAVLAVPFDDPPSTEYLIGVLTGSGSPALAEAFVALVTSDAGASALASAGFGAP